MSSSVVGCAANADAVELDRATVRIGITGHIRLTARSRDLVRDALRDRLRRYGDRLLHGVTCLAAGADQLFAQALLAEHGTYEVILPARDYRARAVGAANRVTFDHLLRHADRVSHAFPVSCTRAYAAAGHRMLEQCDELFAVWDGGVGGVGSTAEIVAAARRRGLPVEVVWPVGARRSPR
ncbi:hypothetical protein WEI85_43440 [Actinomycetes bacterium KLBMP 9797]